MQTNSRLREALSNAAWMLERILEAFSKGTGGPYMSDVAEAIDNARAVLAEPIRNCDVGTADEQAGRYQRFCAAHRCHERTNKCPFDIDKCEFEWGQMPYTEEQKGENDGK